VGYLERGKIVLRSRVFMSILCIIYLVFLDDVLTPFIGGFYGPSKLKDFS
jgi:hypothetical protein